jgi:hypothetical protein
MIDIVTYKTSGFFYDAVKEHFPSGYTKICLYKKFRMYYKSSKNCDLINDIKEFKLNTLDGLIIYG